MQRYKRVLAATALTTLSPERRFANEGVGGGRQVEQDAEDPGHGAEAGAQTGQGPDLLQHGADAGAEGGGDQQRRDGATITATRALRKSAECP